MSRLTVLFVFLVARSICAQPAEEFIARRAGLVTAHPDGLIVLKANALEKAMEQPAWVQDPAFQYFSGLQHVPGGILVIDASAGRSVLFAGPAPVSFGQPAEALDVHLHPELVAGAGLDSVLPWDEFVPWMRERLSEGVGTIYLDEPRRPLAAGVPAGMRAVQGAHALWRLSLGEAFPTARFSSAATTIRGMRWKKSPFEIQALRENARASAAALIRGMRAVGPGVMQRAAEAAVVAGCLEEGAEGPSFWPWMMSGPNAQFGQLIRSFFDNHNLNRAMAAGELVRADIGCAGGGYGGDVGRTVPVSGSFSPDQARVWDLLIVGFRGGLRAMGDGVPLDSVRSASRRAIAAAAASEPGLAGLAGAMNAEDGVNWHIHGIGIESGETAVNPLVAGVVIAYEPGFRVGPDAYYLEDMILITDRGAEILTKGLPYSSVEMAAFLRR
jgi:Xaa-Pro aminopeptidase